MKQQRVKAKIPVIYYEPEDENGVGNPIPYIEVEDEKDFPTVLFIQEYRLTGEFEPDHLGNPSPIADAYMHKFVDLEKLKDKLDGTTYDIVRVALGMDPLKLAQQKGAKILDKVAKLKTEENGR